MPLNVTQKFPWEILITRNRAVWACAIDMLLCNNQTCETQPHNQWIAVHFQKNTKQEFEIRYGTEKRIFTFSANESYLLLAKLGCYLIS
jgi:hypothetical protein